MERKSSLILLLPGLIFYLMSRVQLAQASRPSGACPNTWIYLQGSCYKFSTGTSNWYGAKNACEALGSKLAVVRSQAVNQAITSRLSKPKRCIGLYRDPRDSSSWLWVDGSRATYTNWDKGQPQVGENCVMIYQSGFWHDYPCTAICYYVCEREPNTPKSLAWTATTGYPAPSPSLAQTTTLTSSKTTEATTAACPNTWIYLQGSCYKFSTDTSNWYGAKNACEALGSKLAVVRSQAVNQAITSRLSKPKRCIGLYRDPRDSSSWLWVDGSRATYTNWDKGQSQVGENCVMIYRSGFWHDYPCTAICYYVCEREPNTPKSLAWTATTGYPAPSPSLVPTLSLSPTPNTEFTPVPTRSSAQGNLSTTPNTETPTMTPSSEKPSTPGNNAKVEALKQETSSNETTITVAVVVPLVVMLVISVAVCITWRKWKHRADGSTEDTTELQLLKNDYQTKFEDFDPRLCAFSTNNPEVTEKCCLPKEKQIEFEPAAEKK